MVPRSMVFLLLLSLICCKKEEKAKLTGEAVISTRLYGTGPYYTNGFSFSTGKNHPYPGTSGVRIDLVAQAVTDLQGNLTGVMLGSPDNDKAFFTNNTFSSLAEAESFFSGYTEVGPVAFSALSDTIQPFQVITFRSVVPTYAKMLITSLKFFRGDQTGQYAEVSFRWVYQPDGSTTFP